MLQQYTMRLSLEIINEETVALHTYSLGTVSFSESGRFTLSETEGNENFRHIQEFIQHVRQIDHPDEHWVPGAPYEESYTIKNNGDHAFVFKGEGLDTSITYDPVSKTSTIAPRQGTTVSWTTYLRYIGALTRWREIRQAL